ncbi:hypothetical protein FA15DRAFT_557183, partial [Coprinopsis marcescibilis]
YLKNTFVPSKKSDTNLINETVVKFSLNTEQKRAFSIIAQHAVSENPQQLKMYLGGMGGTGKSQVIHALIHFFNSRNEAHWFIVLAPTGTAAALLNGSTYHSVLGIFEEKIRSEGGIILDAYERLFGVKYIFIDEVSMISCLDLYDI